MSVRVQISVWTSEADMRVVRAPMIRMVSESEKDVLARELSQAVRDVAAFYGIEVTL